MVDPIIVSLFQVKITKIVSPLKIHNQLAIGGLLLGTGLFALMIVNSVGGVILACLTFILGEMLFMPTSFVQCYEFVETNVKVRRLVHGEALFFGFNCWHNHIRLSDGAL